ncbi:MAG: c-type cytochrome domain-containing protein [Planctomycetota bacterium]|jgi:uncharacterized membrane protein
MLTDFLSAWSEPAMRHAMVVHFPIVLSLVGIPVALAAALGAKNGKAMRWTALAVYLGITGMGVLARNSGHSAQDAIYGSLSDEVQTLVEEHDELGHKVWMLGTVVTVLIGASFFHIRNLRLATSWLAVAGALFTAGWTGVTADHGGRLVYEHGAGTPGVIADLLVGDVSADAEPDARIAFFRREVRPILVNNCFRCHNPSRAERAGGLNQTTIAGLLAGGRSGAAIVPGRPGESLIMEAVRGTDPDFVMPPGDNPRLADGQITVLERWITEGAVWEPFEYQLPDD